MTPFQNLLCEVQAHMRIKNKVAIEKELIYISGTLNSKRGGKPVLVSYIISNPIPKGEKVSTIFIGNMWST